MTIGHVFGGSWTEEKLQRLEKYLSAYTTIMTTNPVAARSFRTIYVDAFAGTGTRTLQGQSAETTLDLFEIADDKELVTFYEGSAQRALKVEPAFDSFLFIEKRASFVDQLARLKREYPHKAEFIDIRKGDTNQVLRDWCLETNWSMHRAVVFLDPYGMSVEWETLQFLARTKAIDLWLLVPIGQAINRILTRKQIPTGSWADKLTSTFGTDEWRDRFYRPNLQLRLYSEPNEVEYAKDATFDSIGKFFIERLNTIFTATAEQTLLLRNSKGNPLFTLCFAAANPRGASTAVKIADDVLRKP